MLGILGRLAGLAVVVVVLALIFGALERFWPAIKRRGFIGRRGMKTDLAWFGFTPRTFH
jgi:hypothetical protein